MVFPILNEKPLTFVWALEKEETWLLLPPGRIPSYACFVHHSIQMQTPEQEHMSADKCTCHTFPWLLKRFTLCGTPTNVGDSKAGQTKE
jgi:hypothetical protein